MKMNNRKRCLFSAALACSAAAVAAPYQTVSLVDIQAEIAAYAAKTNEAARLCAAYDKEQRDWRTACNEAKKAGREQPPAPTTTKPTPPHWVPCPIVRPVADTPCLAHPRERNARFMRPVEFRTVGRYSFWIQHWQTANTHTALEFLLRNPDGECVYYQLPDRIADMWTDTHADGRAFHPDRTGGMVWTKVEVDIEYPGEYRLYLSKNLRYVQRGMKVGDPLFAIRNIWVTNDPDADPTKGALKASDIPLCYEAPKGFVRAAYHAPHAMMNSSIEDPQKRPPTNLMECYSWFDDPARYLKYGVTDGLYMNDPVGKEAIARGDRLAADGYQGGIAVGGSVQINADPGRRVTDALKRKYPFDARKPIGPGNEPVGRCQWQDGNWGDFSDSFAEYNELFLEEAKKDVQAIMTNSPCYKQAFCWWTAWEQCGMYDYGPTSRAAFREYLRKRYGTIDRLNAAWRTEYASFDGIEPGCWKYIFGDERLKDPVAWHRNVANYIDFRDFCSQAYATRIGLKTKAIRAFDKKTHISSNLSCNNISSVLWMQWRPLIFEHTAQLTMAGSDMIGYDNYGNDDLYGANYELFDAFGDGRLRPMIREGACHAPGPELQARSQWHNIAKGMQGQACFCVQEANVGELSKFGMTDMFHGATPRPKIAAIADNFRAIHQLEYLISEAKRTRAVKPVAIYYSAVCHLLNEKPYLSMFDTGADNFFRVYELLHANGYDVTFVTDRQILEGGDWFKSLGAILLIDAKYVPTAVQEKLIAWVRDGGNLLADGQSGSFDDHAYPTDTLTRFLGIRPKQKQKADAMAAEKLSFGYSAYSYDVVNSDDLWNTMREIKDAPGGTHPISRMLDKTMFSCMGCNEVECVNGTQVMQENNGGPFAVVRNEGRGTVAYVAGYLGTIYGSGCTRYEQADNHADDSPYRFVDAWATWAGLKKVAVSDIPDDRKYGLRFESPLVDARGNAMMGVVSQLRGPMESFRVKYTMPENFKAPKLVLGSVNASRKLTKLPFAYDEKTRTLTVRMCGFRCWGNILALNEIGPFVSVEQVGGRRDAYGLGWFRPGDEVEYRATVYNPGSSVLADGELELRLSEGWFYDKEKVSVKGIPAYGCSETFSFTVKAPAFNSCRKLEPVNFIYRNGETLSSPAVEMVWFQVEPQRKPLSAFDVE